jgi:hypothetical protein
LFLPFADSCDEAFEKQWSENDCTSGKTPLLFEGEMGIAHEPEFNGVRRVKSFSTVFLSRRVRTSKRQKKSRQ